MSPVFQFLRGAIRGAYGKEDFRSLKFLIVGVSEAGQKLLNCLCFPGVDVSFRDHSLINYGRSFSVCNSVKYDKGDQRDVVVNFVEGTISVRGKDFPLSGIGDDPYTQGIHEFYLREVDYAPQLSGQTSPEEGIH